MEELSSYLLLAHSTTSAEFAARAIPLFLVKRPLDRTSLKSLRTNLAFETKHSELDVDPFATEWRIAPVKKREGNPYPDRFSIGRAPHCDVVVRIPSVSKIHAYILITGPSSFSLLDNLASNATLVNGRKLVAKATSPLYVGDEVAIGALTFEFVDATRLHEILLTEF
jgi:hypothetical protein